MSPFLPELLAAWGDRVAAEGPVRVALAVAVGLAAVWALRRAPGGPRGASEPLRWALGAGAVVVGLLGAVRGASVVDDAFVSFRYARNLVEGAGLVYNPGERVEGMTNLLWTLLLAGAHALSGVEIPALALGMNLVAWTAALVFAARALPGEPPPRWPVAALVLAGSAVARGHATTGLETVLVTLLGVLAMRDLARSPGRAGLWLVLSTLARPDQALLFGAGAVAVLAGGAGGARERLRARLVPYLTPALLLVAATLARLAYYGALVPNTALAKSADAAFWSQGVVYAAEFWLGSWGWTLLPAVSVGWLLGGPGRERRVFVTLAVALHALYVVRLGGDFMAGRFWVCLLAPLAFAAQDAVEAALRGGRRGLVAALAAVLVVGANGASLVPARTIRWYMADEGTVYPVVGWSPVTIDHPSWRIGQHVGRTLADRGLTPLMATGTIGMVGFYGRLPLVDLHGLTDATVAREPVRDRGHVGHEKFARAAYLHTRGVRLVQSERLCTGARHPELTRLDTPVSSRRKPWCVWTWDPALMDALAEQAPEWSFTRPEPWIDALLARLDALSPDEVRAELAWLDDYYFAGTPDPARRDRIVGWLAERGASPAP